MRVWQHYREHMLRLRFSYLVLENEISKEDADNFREFINLKSIPTVNMYIYSKLGLFPENVTLSPQYKSTLKVMEALGLDHIIVDKKTSMPYEQQFWEQFDIIMELNEEELKRELPMFVADPTNRAKYEAILNGRGQPDNQQAI